MSKPDKETLYTWMQAAHKAVRSSGWQPTTSGTVDVLDALIVPLYRALEQTLRPQASAAPPSTGLRLPGFIQERRLPYSLRHRRALWRSRPWTSDGTILFFVNEITHVQAQMPVARLLLADGVSCHFVTSRVDLFDRLYAEHMPVAYAAAGQEQSPRSTPPVPMEQLPVPIFPLDVPALLRRWQQIIDRMLPRIEAASVLAEKLTHTSSGGLLVVGNDITPEGRVLVRQFGRQKRQTAALMHGFINVNDPMHWEHIVHYFLVYGPQNRRQMSRIGFPEDRLIVCGAPHLDNRPTQTGQPHPMLVAKVGWDKAPRALLALSGPGHSVSQAHHERIIEAIHQLAVEYPQVVFAAKLHRKDRPTYYQTVQARFPNVHLPVMAHGAPDVPESIFDWLQGCSVILTGASTVALEAMVMSVPVITVDLMDELGGVDFIEAGATLHARTLSELRSHLESVLNEDSCLQQTRQKADQLIFDTFYHLDGQATRRSADALWNLAQINASR
jgi:hypothetical protein